MENVGEFVKEQWERLTSFSKKSELKEKLWKEIEYRYAEPHRAYHNFGHIAYLFSLLNSYLKEVSNPAVIGFAILYHDIVYDTYRKDNEEQSASIAEAHLNQLLVNKQLIEHVKTFVLATKDHQLPADHPLKNDLAFFLDFDMAILGADFETYKVYSSKIRQEYSQYADELYKSGRKHALIKFLEVPSIFHTEDFGVVIEDTARKNIRKEISFL